MVGGYLPKFSLLLDDLSHLDERAIEARRLTAAARLTVVFLQRLRSSQDPLGEIDRWWSALGEIAAAPHGGGALAAFARYILSVTELAPSQVRQVFQRLGPAGNEAFMTGAQQLTKEVAEKARNQGLVEGRAEIVLRLLTVRFGPLPEQAVERVGRASADELDHFAERVLTAATLDDVLR
jgi:hypothetical protein